ncbi:prepilin peptidase [Chelativorans sp. M5D2P16]|uniref:A24 family peptidase n=1 Tax=Chelativorans sp. M5D2P16 TaxID=3095678 RepID=UPI002ACAB51F|nr:prepilin peptidase [Chelativorans sp. M5D2P16]MDZ5700159.1 prepilin peptidase [Chelativorans sp. M5D2P16]
MLEASVFVIFPFCMAFAAVSDMVSMTIANRISLILVAAFVVLAPLTGMPWLAVGMHLAAGMAVLTVTFTLFAIGGMGGGDAKLMAATAVWFGFGIGLADYLVTSALAGGALTLALLMFRKSPLAMLAGNNTLLRHFADEKAGIPYGVALGLGGLLAYGESPLMQWALARLAG